MINYFELVRNNPEYFKQFTCNDLLFLNYDCPVKVKKVAKWSECNYVYYVLSGQKAFHTTEESITLTKGSMAFVKKGACIVEQFYQDPFCIVVFVIPDSFIVSFLKDYKPPAAFTNSTGKLVIPIATDEITEGFCYSLLPFFAAPGDVPAEMIELKFKELMLHILRNPANIALQNYFSQLCYQTGSPIKEVMESNYAYNLTLDDYARLCNRSVSSFKRDFQSVYKISPGRWLIGKKLDHAKRLLQGSLKTVIDVSFESGFENTAHFCRLFKQKTGITPLQYRKSFTEKREAVEV